MSKELAGRIPKPAQMRGLLHNQIKRNLLITGIGCLIAGSYMKFVYGDGNKRAFANFYLHYDVDKEFEKMRKKGLFDSCDPNEEI